VRRLRFKQVDVFTRVPFRGNPVAVVLEADPLSSADMQRVAAWTNLSETTFVLEPTAPGADYRLRIFTPRHELPFAGHPTLGSAHAVLEAGLVKPKGGKFRQECGAGVLELERDGDLTWVKAPPQQITPLTGEQKTGLGRTLSSSIVGEPVVVRVGPVWVVADLGGSADVDGLTPDMSAIARFTDALGANGITVFGATRKGDGSIHVRSFAPAGGIPEDPVCGSGNISVAAYLSRSGKIDAGGRYTARQGMSIGRDGEVRLRVEGGAIHLGGEAVTCVEGTLSAG